MKPVITKEAVAEAIEKLSAAGQRPTLQAIHAALGGRGSITTLVKIRAEVEAEKTAPTDSAEGLAQFRQLWAAAVTEGRRQMETQLAELRASLDAITTENERLEAAAIADANRVGELQSRLDNLVGEISQANRAATEARAGAASASSQLAQALGDVSTVRAEYLAAISAHTKALTTERERTHALEIERATLTAQLAAERATAERTAKEIEDLTLQLSVAKGKGLEFEQRLEKAQAEIKELISQGKRRKATP